MRKKAMWLLPAVLLLIWVTGPGTCMAAAKGQEMETASEADTSIETETEFETDESGGISAEEEPLQDVNIAGWHIVTQKVRINPSLENISVALGYSGVQTSEFSKTAKDGNTFCLVKLLIEKEGSREEILWENLCLTDGDGNVYHRIEDEFILDLGMKRMPGTKLNFGSNEGWIAFEIPEEAASELTLSYEFENEAYQCELT